MLEINSECNDVIILKLSHLLLVKLGSVWLTTIVDRSDVAQYTASHTLIVEFLFQIQFFLLFWLFQIWNRPQCAVFCWDHYSCYITESHISDCNQMNVRARDWILYIWCYCQHCTLIKIVGTTQLQLKRLVVCGKSNKRVQFFLKYRIGVIRKYSKHISAKQ